MPVAMDAEEQEALPLLIVAVIGVQHFADLPHHVTRVHGTRGFHAPGEAQRARFGLSVFLLLFRRHIAAEMHRAVWFVIVWGKEPFFSLFNLS